MKTYNFPNHTKGDTFRKKDVPKTNPETKLYWKYKKLLNNSETYEELQQLAIDFKKDLDLFLQKNRRYSFMLLLCFNLSFAQSGVVSGGNSNVTIGEVFPVMQQTSIVGEKIYVQKPKTEQPKPIEQKKRKTFFRKIACFFKNLTNK